MSKKENEILKLWELAYAIIECDECGNVICDEDTADVAQVAYDAGWGVNRNHDVKCDECIAKGRRK